MKPKVLAFPAAAEQELQPPNATNAPCARAGRLSITQHLGLVRLEQGAPQLPVLVPQSRRKTRMPEHTPRDARPNTLARTIGDAYDRLPPAQVPANEVL